VLLVAVMFAAAAVVVVEVIRHEAGGTASCVTATPRLSPHKLETDMRRLERLICH
jgi:hypothetical protein